jgi:hypothetical protein
LDIDASSWLFLRNSMQLKVIFNIK